MNDDINELDKQNRLQENFSQRYYRDCLGHYATGVTVVTALDAQRRPVGLTVNSFASVSLEPPLVLWSLENKAASMPVFSNTQYFGISILAADQLELARRFAAHGIDRFQDALTFSSPNAIPLLTQALAWFECERYASHLAGDHTIFIGQVLRVGHALDEAAPQPTHLAGPLLYYRSRLSGGLERKPR